MSKKLAGLLLVMLMSPIITLATIERFYIGKIEVSENDYMGVDSSMIRSKATEMSGDTITYTIIPDIYFKIDTVSIPGRVIVVKRSDEDIKEIKKFMSARRTESAILKIGDTIPDLILPAPFSDDIVNLKKDMAGKVILLNFWATWCDPCLKELEATWIPSIVEKFKDNEHFVFLPVNTNHNLSEIEDFFDSPKGHELSWLKDVSLWDKSSKISNTLSQGGIPLTILIDQNGIISLNESGAFLTEEQLIKLEEKIAYILRKRQN